MTLLAIVKYKVKSVKTPDKKGFKNDTSFGDAIFMWPLNFWHVYICAFYFLPHTQKVDTVHKHISESAVSSKEYVD